MRKVNVFGRKVNQTKALYLIFVVFVLVVGLYYTIVEIQSNQLEELKQQQVLLQNQIDDLLETSQTETYHEVSQIIQYLPNVYNQLGIINEIGFVRNLSGLALATGFSLNFDLEANSPFVEKLPSTVQFVEISISMTVSDATLILDFMDNLLDQDQIYMIDSLFVNYLIDGRATVQLVVFTFYNNVLVS